ncbi:MAG: glycosyltransferase [Clostridia bacterium]|nr:glycosyltransferase [Clostridia bacterium]
MIKEQKKKILFLIHDLGGGGAEKVLVNLVNHMDHERFDVHVTALFGGGVNENALNDQVHYRCVWKRSFPANSRILRRMPAEWLHKICVKEKYDVEIAYLEDICAKVISGCSSKTTDLVCWIHTDLHDKSVASRGFASFEESQRGFAKFGRFVSVSETVQESFLSIYPNVQNAVVRYNTLETERILAQKDEPIEDDLFRQDEIKLTAVGKICQLKGFDRLARIVKRLRDDGLPVHLYALGTGPDQRQIEAYLAENGLSDYYTFLGYQTNPYKYVAKCDLFVCASHAEGFSTAATEALIVGTPVCTVEVSGMKEMLGAHNEWGVVTENDDEALYQGIKRLVSDPALLSHYREKAKERGKTFSTENTVKAVEALFEKDH